ncbi:T9SS type A sorting domain-containing protein [uncultured Chryseobacterium sp.]|uniref:T9SS type A sorting domain-containing protein n=1 Tax=uncultured Chryseobacterium sp. TaxID=259322 RepID=UPI00260B5617|nr:T9SS type A sorting domain-containing protein [uncultured Chryseobacterium sp.]
MLSRLPITGHAVNLNNYKLNIQTYDYSTGNYYFSDSYELEGTAAPGETFVVMNPEASLPCYSVSQAKFVTAAPPMMYTGTQYIELAYKSTAVDVVGTKDMLNANNNVSLYRLTSVTHPTTTFNSSEWQSYSTNYCENLGVLAAQHVVIAGNEIRLYPNPVSEGNLFAKGEDVQKISKAQIYDVSGKLISEENSPFKTKKSIDVSQLKAGVYLLVLDGKSFRFIKK